MSIHDILFSRRNSQEIIHGDEKLIQLDGIVERIEEYTGDFIKLTSRDVKLLSSITSLLAEEFGRVFAAPFPAIVISCKLKALFAIYLLLRIPAVSKNAFESCLMGLVNSLNPKHTGMLSLALKIICNGMVAIDDDSFRCAAFLRLEKLGFYDKMLRIMHNVIRTDEEEEGGTDYADESMWTQAHAQRAE